MLLVFNTIVSLALDSRFNASNTVRKIRLLQTNYTVCVHSMQQNIKIKKCNRKSSNCMKIVRLCGKVAA